MVMRLFAFCVRTRSGANIITTERNSRTRLLFLQATIAYCARTAEHTRTATHMRPLVTVRVHAIAYGEDEITLAGAARHR